jgi:hypothetical protein
LFKIHKINFMLTNQISKISQAILALPFPAGKIMSETAQEWVELFCYPESDNAQIQPLQISLTVPTAAVTIIARNDRPVLAKQLAKLLATNKYPEVETKLLQLGFKELPTAALSCEIEMQGELRDVRWQATAQADDALAISNAFKLLPDGVIEQTLNQWYEEAESDACLSIGRSVGGAYTCWETELPGDSVRYALSAYSSLCRTLAVEGLPDEISDQIDADSPETMTMAARFTKNGATKTGLIIYQPSDEMVQLALLASTSGSNELMQRIATFEAALGKEKADKIEFAMSIKGLEIQFFYNL